MVRRKVANLSRLHPEHHAVDGDVDADISHLAVGSGI